MSELSSLGILYGVITRLLGFIPDRHEGKVMGLAARGTHTDCVQFFESLASFSEIDGTVSVDYAGGYEPFLREGSQGVEAVLLTYRKEDVAFAIQHVLENLIVDYVGFHTQKLWSQGFNLCLAGGVASNVRMNMKLRELDGVKNLYVAPAMTDGGNALGGALAVATDAPHEAHKVVIESFYLGPEFSENEILDEILSSGLKFQRLSPLESEVLLLERLSQGRIVGIFQGRSEFGPRALGNRSILASPASPGIAKELNRRLHRNDFMPFGPVTTSEIADKCFVGWEDSHVSSEYMTMCYSVTDWFRDLCPSVVHVDGTVRPQVIHADKNPSYHSLVRKFFEIRGVPALINTSFNLHEEPIVNSPADALKAIQRSAIDDLHIGPFIVTASQ
jgi:carbamoyltransferase